MIILIVLIILLTSILCCYNEYRRRKRQSAPPLNYPDEQIQQEPPLLNAYCPSSSRPPSPSSAPHFWMNTIRRWKTFRHGLPPDDHIQTVATTVPTTTTIPSIDELPSYEGILFI